MNYRTIFCYLLVLGYLFSSSVNIYNAEVVARNLHNIHHALNPPDELIITSVEVLKDDFNELIYLFHLGLDGFIMISADDRSAPILAYSFENSFKLNGMSHNVSWMINQFKNNIQNLIISNALIFATEVEPVTASFSSFKCCTNGRGSPSICIVSPNEAIAPVDASYEM